MKQLSDLTLQKSILENDVLSFCPYCLKAINSKIVEINGKVFLEKKCCKEMQVLLENDSNFFKKISKFQNLEIDSKKIRNLQDLDRNVLSYAPILTISLTLDCNLDCPVCYLKYEPNKPHKINISLEDIVSIVKKNKHKLVYLTGGEPTLRKDLPEIIRSIVENDCTPVLCTNGLKLVNIDYVRELKKSGLKIVALSFDGFDNRIYRFLRGKNLLSYKLIALKNLENENMNVWLVPVVAKGVNDHHIAALIRFAYKSKFIKQVTFSPLFLGGEAREYSTTYSDIIKTISKEFKKIKIRNFIEQRKLYCNIYKIIKKLSNGIINEKIIQRKFGYIHGSNTIYFMAKENEICPFFPLKKLIELNKISDNVLKEDSKIKAFYLLIKNVKKFIQPELIYLALNLLLGDFNFPETFRKLKLFKIGFATLESTINIDLKRMHLNRNIPENVISVRQT